MVSDDGDKGVLTGRSSSDGWTERLNVGSALGPEFDWGTSDEIPERYFVREDERGRYLTCIEAPNVAVRIDRGVAVSGAQARKASAGTVFLDGAAQGEPFIDAQRKVFNLDHHDGCVRSFTLATCEQALVMVRRGLDLRGGEWNLVGNDPDIDTVLAIWVLLNHVHLGAEDSPVRAKVTPLLRLAGTIDAHGLEMLDLCGLPEPELSETMELLEHFREEEVQRKKDGEWGSLDFLEFTARSLRAIDEAMYAPHQFRGLMHVEELIRVPVSEDRTAVVCRAESGIYEVERHLGRLHGDRIGVIILQKDERTYTVRQVDPFLPTQIDRLYERLNVLDPAVGGGEGNLWGGSSEIGGSPRATGTGLSAREIATICERTFRPPALRERAGAVALAVSMGVAAVMVALAAALGSVPETAPPGILAVTGAGTNAMFGGLLVVVAVGLTVVVGRRHLRRFGLGAPTGWGWLLLTPIPVALGWVGGLWMPPNGLPVVGGTGSTGVLGIAAAGLAAAGAELLFRGLTHGMLVAFYPVAGLGGRVRVSFPVVLGAVVSSVIGWLLFCPLAVNGWPGVPVCLAGGLVLGVVTGVARERWQSVWVAVFLHAGVVVALAAVASG